MKACAECPREASRRGLCHNHYENRRRKEVAYGRWQSTMIDAEPARQHVKALMAVGLGSRRIAELSGVQRGTMQWLITGRSERGYGPSKRISDTNAQRLLAIPIPEAPHHLVAGGARIPALGTTRRLQALVAIGYTQVYLSHRIGWTASNSTRLFTGRADYVIASSARRVETVFNELQLIPGPNDRSRRRAKQLGWVPPLAWDEDTIDHPDAKPDLGEPDKVTFADRYQELRDLGYPHKRIADKLGIQIESLDRQLMRHGMAS